jgi:hypothetical protein
MLDSFGDSDRTAFVEVAPGIEFRVAPSQKDSVVDAAAALAFAVPVLVASRTEIEHHYAFAVPVLVVSQTEIEHQYGCWVEHQTAVAERRRTMLQMGLTGYFHLEQVVQSEETSM